MRFKRVGVLMGGLSAEREVSLASGRAVADGLVTAGYDVARIDVGPEVDRQLREAAVEAVFIALHGRWGEDGTMQGLLELLGLPYTGSSLVASALAMDKDLTRRLLGTVGIPVARGVTLSADAEIALPPGLAPPVVVKPATEGSSVGVSIVRTKNDLAAAVAAARGCSARVVVEQLVSGTEVNVAVLDGEVLGAVEIEPHREFYDYSAKYDAGGSTHHIPPRIPSARTEEAARLALGAYQALGCAGAARVDLIVPPAGQSVVLEVNTIPGMTTTSLLPEIALAAGLQFDRLVARIMEGARLHVGLTG